jgi:hypothetical protein
MTSQTQLAGDKARRYEAGQQNNVCTDADRFRVAEPQAEGPPHSDKSRQDGAHRNQVGHQGRPEFAGEEGASHRRTWTKISCRLNSRTPLNRALRFGTDSDRTMRPSLKKPAWVAIRSSSP